MKNLFESFESKYGVKNSEDQAALNKRAILREGYYDSTVADFLSDLDAIGLDDIDTLEIYSDKATPDYQGDRWSVPEDLLKRTVSSFSANKIYLTVDETPELAVNESKTKLKEASRKARKRCAEAATTRKPLKEAIKDPDALHDILDEAEFAIEDAISAVERLADAMGGRIELNLERYMLPQLRAFINGPFGGGDTLADINDAIDEMESDEDLDESCKQARKKEKELEEAKSDLTQIPGTIAYCLNQHMKEINFGASALELKKTCIDLVTSDPSIPRNTVQDFINKLNNCRNQDALLSTISTYMLGTKVIR